MKTKSISKIISVLFALMMTICLTSCEDESVPAYGTGVESEAESNVRYNLSPTAPVETEPAAPVEAYIYSARIDYSDLIGDYVAITIVITNNTGENLTAGNMVGIDAVSDGGVSLSLCTTNPTFINDEGIKKEIANGEQKFAIYTCAFMPIDIAGVEYIDITLQSQYVDDILDYQRFYLTEE